MKVFSITAALSLVATLASARDCPLESECIQKSCKNFNLNEGNTRSIIGLGIANIWELTAECKDNAGKKTLTKLNLGNCLGNFDGNLVWAKYGDFDCKGCKLKKTDPVLMECLCYSKKKKPLVREISLSEGIWVYDGAIGCYQGDWHKTPGIGNY
ncbi:CVNH domain-containing protein [Colletotrichum incanum]|nr:CVNH domain-containing protein [Colletotrichum incanum]